MHASKLTRTAAACCISFLSSTAFAQTDALIEGAKECTRQLPRFERQYGVPQHLLTAISSTETGRWHDGLKISLPWPWTINAEGKAYYLNSKAEAVATARKLQLQGIKSMDVGCMQVNLLHHPQAFANLEDAFTPEKNIAYAASFLRNLYQDAGNWKKAAADYHSKTPNLGAQYVSTVYDKWYNIINKLRLARGIVKTAEISTKIPAPIIAAAPAAAAAPMIYKLDKEQNLKPISKPAAPATPNATASLGEQTGKKLAPQQPVHMKLIKISDSRPKRQDNLIVLRPQAENTTQTASASLKEINVASAPPAHIPTAPTPAPAKGPRFIFND